MANAMKYQIERKTTSTDAVPEGLQGTLYWYDTGTTQNGEAVYYDNATSTYAYWYDGSEWLISGVADVGGAPTDYFKLQDYPLTIEVSGIVGGSGTYEYSGTENGKGRWNNGDFGIRWDVSWIGVPDDSWAIILDGGGPPAPPYGYIVDSSTLPPKSGWTNTGAGAAALEYTVPANQYVGQGAWSGTITVGEYTIADAWYRAETICFESFRNYSGNEEERDCFRGYLPQNEFGDPTQANVWMMTSGGSAEFDIVRLAGDNASWCSLRTDARIDSIWDTRQKAMEFSGLVLAWLKENDNMTEQGNIEWCRLTDIPQEPEIYTSKGQIPKLYWNITIPLELIYKTENVFE